MIGYNIGSNRLDFFELPGPTRDQKFKIIFFCKITPFKIVKIKI